MQPRLDLLSKYFSKHHVYRLLGFIFIEEYRIQQEVLLQNVGCARSCGKILRIILTEVIAASHRV